MLFLRYIFLFLVLVQGVPGHALHYRQKSLTFSIDINHPDSSVHTSVLVSASRVKTNQFATYHWYGNGSIHTTDGGFSGRLLHGQYTSYYPDRNLKVQGQFSRGLKQGKWITWYPTGRIHEVLHFSNGALDGSYEVYDLHGKLLTRTNYKHGVKHGKTTMYSPGKSDSIVSYKKGVRIDRKNVEVDTSNATKSHRNFRKDGGRVEKRRRTKADSIGVDSIGSSKVKTKSTLAKEDTVKPKKRITLRNLFRPARRAAKGSTFQKKFTCGDTVG